MVDRSRCAGANLHVDKQHVSKTPVTGVRGRDRRQRAQGSDRRHQRGGLWTGHCSLSPVLFYCVAWDVLGVYGLAFQSTPGSHQGDAISLGALLHEVRENLGRVTI